LTERYIAGQTHSHSLAALAALLLVACTPAARREEPLPVPPVGKIEAWAMQLQGLERSGAADRLSRADVDLVVIDRLNTVRGSGSFPVRAVVRQVHASRGRVRPRKLCLAYVNVGQAEDYRAYWKADWAPPGEDGPGHPPFVLGRDPEGWEGNYPVAYWRPEWKRVLFGAPGSLVDGAVREEFDGVVLDWVAGWSNDDVRAAARKDGVDPAREMAKLVGDLAAYARSQRPGFLVVPLNAAALLEKTPDLAASLDGVIQEDVSFAGAASSDWDDPANADRAIPATGVWSTETHVRRLTGLAKRGLLIFTLDYAAEEANRREAVERARRHGFVPFVSRTPLDRIPREILVVR
jgi:cysteinyl-tRNA synthetase